MAATRCDVAIAGAGLAGALIALALARRHPGLDVRLIDAGEAVGGNHVWSFFAPDVAAEHRWLVDPLVVHRWPSYQVAFPRLARTLAAAYHSIESERLDAVVRKALPPHALMLGRGVAELSSTAVLLADGTRVEAGGVIDARGAGDLGHFDLGWQKFVGRELVLADPHGRAQPMVMDGSVAQHDGFRFVYCLPFAADRMFVEDTYYSDDAALDEPLLHGRIDDYATAQGWRTRSVVREERGALPVVIEGDFDGYWVSGGRGIAKAGARAGLFHPTTGYSLPDAVRLAVLIADRRDLDGPALHEATHGIARTTWQARGFYRLLDRLLFRACDPADRYRVLERFYRLNPCLIGRFYAGRSTMTDKARVLAGKPPVPLWRAIRTLVAS